MREMKDSGVAWIGAVPSDYGTASIGSLFTIKKDIIGREPETVLSITQTGIRPKDLFSNEGQNASSYAHYQIVNVGDFAMNHMDLLTGWIDISKYEGVTSPDYRVFTLNDKEMSSDYFLRVFQYYYTNRVFFGFGQGVATLGRWRLPAINFKKIDVPVPPLSEQWRIVSAIDENVGKVDMLIANVQAQIEKLKAYKQSLITEVVTKGLAPTVPMKDSGVEWIGEIPETWSTIRVKQLLKERKERSVDGSEEPLSMSQKLGLVPTRMMDMVPNMASSFVGAKLAYINDLVFNKLKAHLGVFSVSKYDGLVSPDYAVYYSTGKVHLKYLEYLFKTPQCISEFRKRSTGIAAGLTRLYTDGLFAIECPFPEMDEQIAIVDYLNEKCSQIDQLIAIKQAKIEKLEQYKCSLIYEYVTGKKEVPAQN